MNDHTRPHEPTTTPEPPPALLDLIEYVIENHDGHAIAYHRGVAYPIRFHAPEPANCVRGCTMTEGHSGTCCICGAGSATCRRGCPSRPDLLADYDPTPGLIARGVIPDPDDDLHHECGRPWEAHEDDGVQMLCPEPTTTQEEEPHDDDETAPTRAEVDALLLQVQRDKASPYWQGRRDILDAVETYLESLRDWLPEDPAPEAPSPEPPTSEPRLRIEDGWLVREVDYHTCGTESGGHFGIHEPGCGLLPELHLANLPGWPETTTATTEDADLVGVLRDNWRVFRKHIPGGAYPPTGQLDGDCRECGGPWPCAPVRDALATPRTRPTDILDGPR